MTDRREILRIVDKERGEPIVIVTAPADGEEHPPPKCMRFKWIEWADSESGEGTG